MCSIFDFFVYYEFKLVCFAFTSWLDGPLKEKPHRLAC